jgi:hypothetical protein
MMMIFVVVLAAAASCVCFVSTVSGGTAAYFIMRPTPTPTPTEEEDLEDEEEPVLTPSGTVPNQAPQPLPCFTSSGFAGVTGMVTLAGYNNKYSAAGDQIDPSGKCQPLACSARDSSGITRNGWWSMNSTSTSTDSYCYLPPA